MGELGGCERDARQCVVAVGNTVEVGIVNPLIPSESRVDGWFVSATDATLWRTAGTNGFA